MTHGRFSTEFIDSGFYDEFFSSFMELVLSSKYFLAYNIFQKCLAEFDIFATNLFRFLSLEQVIANGIEIDGNDNGNDWTILPWIC